ncbi:hypothetical protein ACWC9T_14280 [Kitasatospora sp. NPDC001159]
MKSTVFCARRGRGDSARTTGALFLGTAAVFTLLAAGSNEAAQARTGTGAAPAGGVAVLRQGAQTGADGPLPLHWSPLETHAWD